MIFQVDVDGSGVVEFEEFVQFIARLMKNTDPENEVRECYRRSGQTNGSHIIIRFVTRFGPRFDPENEGVIRTEELRFIMSNLPVRLSDKVVSKTIARLLV